MTKVEDWGLRLFIDVHRHLLSLWGMPPLIWTRFETGITNTLRGLSKIKFCSILVTNNSMLSCTIDILVGSPIVFIPNATSSTDVFTVPEP